MWCAMKLARGLKIVRSLPRSRISRSWVPLDRLADLVVADPEIGSVRAGRGIAEGRDLAVAPLLQGRRRRGVVAVAVDDHRRAPWETEKDRRPGTGRAAGRCPSGQGPRAAGRRRPRGPGSGRSPRRAEGRCRERQRDGTEVPAEPGSVRRRRPSEDAAEASHAEHPAHAGGPRHGRVAARREGVQARLRPRSCRTLRRRPRSASDDASRRPERAMIISPPPRYAAR